ncbi:extracellular solute-binding protein [Dankookia rubra]|uniref:Extracellular solute-binding protein n=1 Tax=Dankookia rubra TaxID=1442381 RepID=A0A4V3A9H3_9PROT|nr:extracellular solute-binding protein [Dankookia rubra]TDH59215.1 extracellular solute-binding protein [Dankookia rubra]
MIRMSRRAALSGTLATSLLATPRLRAQGKPEKLVYIGDNQGGWKRALVEEVAPAFEKETGIRIEFTLLPTDAWRTRLKAEMGARSTGVDIAQWSPQMGGWMAPHLVDHEEVLAKIQQRDPQFNWDDFLAGTKKAAAYDGRLIGIPYRITTGILHYQRPIFERAGVSQPPQTFAEFLEVAQKVNGPPDRYAVGIMGKQGSGTYTSFASWLYSAGGQLVDFKTGEVFINQTKAVEALRFYAEMMAKHKVVVPEATTWEYDEIIGGGQRDRYAMAQTFAPYGSLINDPTVSKTAGNWAWAIVPGHTDIEQSRTWIDGHFLSVPRYAKNPDWSIEFIRMACSQRWQRRSMERGNAPPRGSVLRDSDMAAKYGWSPVAAKAIETGVPTPSHPVFDSLELTLRPAISQCLIGERTAQQALDEVAADWRRTLRRAGVGR